MEAAFGRRNVGAEVATTA
jgi:hypothetical protein